MTDDISPVLYSLFDILM